MSEPILGSTDFVVIAAVDNDVILEACLKRSPDVADGRLRLITVRNAESISKAYNVGLKQSDARICVLAHQDVYLPVGWLDRAISSLSALTCAHSDWRIAGPYGVQRGGQHIGRVWDVTIGRELGKKGFGPTPVESLDELLIIVRRDGPFGLDEDLPDWHLYGTDIVQEAIAAGKSAWAIELPVVHNNRPIASLRGGYERAYKYARRKWRDNLPIWTTICEITWNPLALWRAQWRRRHVKVRPEGLLADAVLIAQGAGYE